MHSRRTLTPRILVLVLAAAMLVAGCSGGTATATPTAAPDDNSSFSPLVSATGVVVPQQWARISVRASGQIVNLPVEAGDQVAEGDLLLALDSRPALLAAEQGAQLELVNARQALQSLQDGADMARAQAEQELANAQDALKDADYILRVRQKGNRASQETLDAAQASYVLAQDNYDRAKAAYDRLSGRPEDSVARAIALQNMNNARLSRDSALRSLNWYKGSPTDIQQSQMEADVAVAQARVDEATRTLARMQNGPDSRALEAAHARLANAEAAHDAAQTQLDAAEVRAPFSGTVTEVQVRPYEWVGAGTPVIVIADLSALRIETTDLNEIDAARVHIGDSTNVSFDAVPEFSGRGTVDRLLPMPSTSGGTNYTAWIRVDSIPDSILWGMTAFVDIEVSE